MIFLHSPRLVFLSQPKTGTTALESALATRASMAVNGPPELKHISYAEFMTHLAPWIESRMGLTRQDYLVVTVMREPLDWVGSWYRYRTRKALQKADSPRAQNYTGNISFDDFVQAVVLPVDNQPPFARIQTPSWVARDASGNLGIDRLYPYEDLSGLYELIESRSGKPLDIARKNVSPEMPLTPSQASVKALRDHYAEDFALHASLRADGRLGLSSV